MHPVPWPCGLPHRQNCTLDRQFDPGSMKLASPEGAGDTVNDPSTDEEAASTDGKSDPEDPTVAWCPPIPDAAEDSSEDEIASAADHDLQCPTQRKPVLHTRKPWSSPTVVATGKIDVVSDCHPRKLCVHLAECGL